MTWERAHERGKPDREERADGLEEIGARHQVIATQAPEAAAASGRLATPGTRDDERPATEPPGVLEEPCRGGGADRVAAAN